MEFSTEKHHMGYNEFISLLLKEHHKKEHTIATHIADGIPPEKKCKKNILRNEAVKRLYDEYRLRNMSINDYLHGIQSNIRVD